ncbi:hypothetical protein IPM62_05835 [Candidatus Woesebacteria bacterium]|nr:MAG: hypothetical protein IPM62_05835 [Candidatus Woesebacteria bacterium]
MKEILESILLLERAKATFGLPEDGFTIVNGIIVPTTPCIQHSGSRFFSEYPWKFIGEDGNKSALVLSPRQQVIVENAWGLIINSVSHITNPYTPFHNLDGGVLEACKELYLAGTQIAHTIEGARIVLPPTIGLKPSYTAAKVIGLNGLTLKYNLWVPPDVHSKNETVEITITSTGSKTRSFRI